ncbi:hypothetical protein M2168_006014 [Streptomyces sp. CZ24]|nr:hypothetical protein [Streptomyces sp. CZ24]
MTTPDHRTRTPGRPVHRRHGHAVLTTVLAALFLGSLGNAPVSHASGTPVPPAAAECPPRLASTARCWTGQDDNGAHWTMAVPADRNGALVVHAHGGPGLGDTSDPERSTGDLERFAVMVEEGYAWAGSAYRRGGYGTRMAATDTENVRRLFTEHFGRPGRTYLHGQSWGGNAAAKTAETYGTRPGAYDGVLLANGVLLTNGVLGGGSRGYDHRVDLRVVYQYYCRNHPRPTEHQYPLWKGLRAGSPLTPAGLRARLDECTGLTSDPADRTAPQQRNLDDILAVTRIPERSLEAHLRFATFTFRDLVTSRLDGRNPFGNQGVRYTGSHDDKALNAGVDRFAPDPTARRDHSWDSDLTGKVSLPVLALHAIDDPPAFVEHGAAYRAPSTAPAAPGTWSRRSRRRASTAA